MRIIAWIVCAVLGLAAPVPAAEKRADLGGTWALVPEKSEMERKVPGIRNLDVTGSGVPTKGRTPEALPELSPSGFMNDLRLEISQTEDRIRIVRRYTLDGERGLITQEFAFDGSRCLNIASDGRGGFASRSGWKNGKLLNSGIQTITDPGQHAENNVQEEFDLSRDGKKLTIKTLIATPRGIVKLKQVFVPNRQP